MPSTTRTITLEETLELPRKQSVGLYRDHVNPDLCSLFGLLGLDRRFVKDEGEAVTDENGREYLDFLGGYGSLSLSHNHPEVTEAVGRVESMPNLRQASVRGARGAARRHRARRAGQELLLQQRGRGG